MSRMSFDLDLTPFFAEFGIRFVRIQSGQVNVAHSRRVTL